MGELTCGLSRCLFVQYSLHCIENITAVFGSRDVGEGAVLMQRGDNLRNLRCHWLFGVLDLFDSLVALVGQVSQNLPKADHAVVCGCVGTLLFAVLFRYLARLIFTLFKSVSEVVDCVALLFGKRTCLCAAQHVGKVRESGLHCSPVKLAMRQCHQIVVVYPLIADDVC
ncbi:hypothetical protein A5647_03255 [Mycobacterium sp. 1100029.7]|nr:hypothetical protein A5647_03255 [Mycobacterium sp. 1100029.7]